MANDRIVGVVGAGNMGSGIAQKLAQEGFEVVLLNSNPATIMTDPDFADRTYIEPVTPAVLAKIIEKERPDAVLPTLGGQTALTTAVSSCGQPPPSSFIPAA